ncbi:MAG TPA: ABC transporter substrate-binding protein [Methylophilaceae bacterium]
MKGFVTLLPVALLAVFTSFACADDLVTPDVVAKDTTNEVLDFLKSDPSFPKVQVSTISGEIEQAALPHFDLGRMTKIALGDAWEKTTPEQRVAVHSELHKLFTYTLSSALSHYDGQPVKYLPLHMKPGDTEAEVTARVQVAPNDYDTVTFSMESTDDGWKIYDLTYEGVSMAKNYRSQFSSLIKQAGVDGLIQKLEQKNNVASASKNKN